MDHDPSTGPQGILRPDECRLLPIGDIAETRQLLRLVNRESVEFLEMYDSIEEKGLTNSICVRPLPIGRALDRDYAAVDGRFEVVDGMYRFTVVRLLGWTEVPAIIKYGLTDDDVLALQISDPGQRRPAGDQEKRVRPATAEALGPAPRHDPIAVGGAGP